MSRDRIDPDSRATSTTLRHCVTSLAMTLASRSRPGRGTGLDLVLERDQLSLLGITGRENRMENRINLNIIIKCGAVARAAYAPGGGARVR